jgi:nucleotide-binding universal stress UspA family protein
MYDRILVPTDGSTGTAHVAMQAFDLAEQYEATVHLLSVVDDDVGSILGDARETTVELQEHGRRALDTLEGLAEVYLLEPVSELREGDPAEEILAYADEIDADLIVMGTHGRTGIERRVIGSVAERVVRHAERPVMTVRLPETDRTVTDAAQAERIAAESLDRKGYGGVVVDGASQQLSVWIVEASADGTDYTVYVDPVTQRTSAVRRTPST